MRLVVWNMNKQTRAWDYLRERKETFDVALLQETRDPRSLGVDWSSVVWRPKNGAAGSRRTLWGSAVVAPVLELEAFEELENHPWLSALGGSAAIARGAGNPSWFASVHAESVPVPKALLEALPWNDIPLSTPNGSVWETDILPYELHRLFKDESFVWGGDLNSAESMDDVRGFIGGNRKLREIWRTGGSIDLRLRFHPEEQQTFFRANRRPYQLDHVFADPATESRVRSWHVDRTVVALEPPISDHAPILVELG